MGSGYSGPAARSIAGARCRGGMQDARSLLSKTGSQVGIEKPSWGCARISIDKPKSLKNQEDKNDGTDCEPFQSIASGDTKD